MNNISDKYIILSEILQHFNVVLHLEVYPVSLI